MGRKKQISDRRRLYTERMRLQKGVFSSLANAAGHIGELYADFVQSDEVRNSMKATADKVTECMDGIRELMVLKMDDVELLDLAFGFVRGCYNQQIKKEQEAENNGEM